MSEAKINFPLISWDGAGVGVRTKVVARDGKRLRLVEFTEAFVEHEWCLKGHAGYVLGGELEILFADRIERFAAGDGIMIAGGQEDRHKAKALGSSVRLILVEDE